MLNVYVNEKKNTVVAKLDDCSLDAVCKIIKKYPWIGTTYANLYGYVIDDALFGDDVMSDLFYDLKLDVALIPDTFTRKAVASHGDVFDEATGRRIAISKVTTAHKASVKKAIKRWEKTFLHPVE